MKQDETCNLLRKALAALRKDFHLHYGPSCTLADEALRLTASIEQPTSEADTIDRLERICAAAYQMAGILNAPVRFMDALANPLDATDEEIEALLPIVTDKPGTFDGPVDASCPTCPWETACGPVYCVKCAEAYLAEPSIQMPDGLTKEEMRSFIVLHAEPAGAPVDERATLIQDALDIAFDLVNEEAHRIHETYKGYKPHKHAAIDADVATVTAARAALQQPGLADTLSHIHTSIEIYYKALDKREHGGAAQNRAFEAIQSAMGMTWGDWIAATPSPQDKP